MSEYTPSEKTVERLTTWSEQLGIEYSELLGELVEGMDVLEKQFPDMAPTVRETRARRAVYDERKGALRSNAIVFDYMALGLAEPFDVNESMRTKATNMYQNNRELAVKQGYTMQDGTPMYRAGYNKGKVIPDEPSYLTNMFFVGKPKGSDVVQPGIVALTGARATGKVPIGVPLRSRFNMKKSEGWYICNDSTTTAFTPSPEEMLDPAKMIETFCIEHLVNPDELLQYAKDNQGNYERVAIVEVDFPYYSLNENPEARSDMVIMDDESLGFFDADGNEQSGISGWSPKIYRDMLSFGFGSRGYAIGNATVGEGWDSEERVALPDIERAMMNVWGIHILPEYRVSIDEA